MPAPPPPPPSKKGGLAPPPPPPARGGSKPGNAPSPAPPASPKGPPRPQDPSSPHANTSANGPGNGPSPGLSPGGPGDERRGSGTVNGRPASPGRLAHPPPAKHRPGSGGGSGSGKRPSSRERRGSASGRASPPASPRQRPSSPQRLRPDSPGARSTDDDNHNSHGDHGRRTASPPPPSGPRPGSPSGTGVRPGSPSSLGMAGRPVTPPTRANASAGLGGGGGVRILVSVPARDVGAESRPARVVPVDARPMDTVEEVKTRVQGEIGVAPVARSKQRLLLERKHLLEGLTLEACDLAGRGADVRLDLEDDIPVKVQLPPDREITLDVFLSDYCGTVKTMVQDKEGVSLALRESQGLLFNGKKLKDYLTLEEAGVVPGCELIFDDAEKVPPSPTPYLVAGVVLLSLGLLLFIICLILCCTSARMG